MAGTSARLNEAGSGSMVADLRIPSVERMPLEEVLRSLEEADVRETSAKSPDARSEAMSSLNMSYVESCRPSAVNGKTTDAAEVASGPAGASGSARSVSPS